jgi:DNA-binding NarL/FixJ family response regulator
MVDTHRAHVAVVNDYELVVAGVVGLLSRFPDRLVVDDAILIGEPVATSVDVALYDTFGREGVAEAALRTLVQTPEIRRVAVFSVDLHPDLIADGRVAGAHGFISKALPGEEIADAIVRIAAGESLVAATPTRRQPSTELAWPGKDEGLTERESEVIVLAAEGLSNREIAAALYLSADTVKGYMSQALQKLELRNRVQAAGYVHRSGAFRRVRSLVTPQEVGGAAD